MVNHKRINNLELRMDFAENAIDGVISRKIPVPGTRIVEEELDFEEFFDEVGDFFDIGKEVDKFFDDPMAYLKDKLLNLSLIHI